MKITSRVLLAALVLGLVLASAPAALAADLEHTADVSVSLSSPAIYLTITKDSDATTYQVNAGNVVATIPASSRFYINSSSRNLLVTGSSGNATIISNCSASGLAMIEVQTGSSVETLTFTPAALQCSGGGGGVGGGSSSGSSGGSSGGGGGTPPPASPTVPAPPASTGSHQNGTLVLDTDGTIYLIQGGLKLGFRNPEEYMSHGYRFDQAVPASAADRALPSASAVAKALNGTLALDKTDNRTIYMIAAGKKRGFTSAEVFIALGYKFSQATAIDLTDYEAGDPVSDADMPHPNGALVLQSNGTVWWILGGQRQGFESAEVFYTYGFTFGRVVAANAADLALPEGSLVKFRDGTLVKDGDVYYLISDGAKKTFASSDDLVAKGYKLVNVITASLAQYTVGGMVQ